MSAFYDLASLVLVPSGYKASKVYAQKPLTTDGQLAFSRASAATRVNSAGLIEEVASNVPRLDYQGATCGPRLLLEPTRTNLALQSETFQTTWAPQTVTITANATTAPNGTLTADKIVAAVGAGTAAQHRVDQTTVSAAGAYTFSVYAKKAETQYIFLRIGTSLGAYCDLNNGQILGVSVGITAKSEDAGNGWYRIIITNAAASANEVIRINLAVTVGNLNFIGNGTDGAFIWGAQYEAGSYATSYTGATTTAAVTRLADACSKTGISSLIGQTEGTFYVEVNASVLSQMAASDGQRIMMASDGTNANRVIMNFYIDGSNRLAEFGVISGNVVQSLIGVSTTGGNKTYKIAAAYKTNDFVLYVDGVQVGTDTSGSTFSGTTLSRLDVGQDRTGTLQQSNPIAQVLLFKTRLTNAQLAEITTL